MVGGTRLSDRKKRGSKKDGTCSQMTARVCVPFNQLNK